MAEDELALSFGRELRSARHASGLSQEALAADCGLDRTYISLLERGIRMPTLRTVFTIANALGVPASKMIRSIEKDIS